MNMGRHSQVCPEGLMFYEQSSIRLCGRVTSTSQSGSCSSTYFSSRNVKYSEVCGRVLAYQYSSTDAFGHVDIRNDIDTSYVDGVSITHGSPRKHIWTFASGLQDTVTSPNKKPFCPCNNDSIPSHKPDFIGNDYYCESGVNTIWEPNTLYRDDPLFDNEGCGPLETACCNKGLLPYFHKKLGGNFTNDIEFRICSDQETANEDVRVSIIELFIR